MLGPGGATIITHEEISPGGPGRRRTVAAKGIITLEVVRAQIMHVHMIARLNVLAREANRLPILDDRRPLLDRPNCHFVAHADAFWRRQARAVYLKLNARLQLLGGHGDIVFRAKVNGDLSHGHGATPEIRDFDGQMMCSEYSAIQEFAKGALSVRAVPKLPAQNADSASASPPVSPAMTSVTKCKPSHSSLTHTKTMASAAPT